MKKNNFTVISENQKSDFFYEKRKSNLNITFNRVSFIFFIFFIISTIFSIHLIHLVSRNDTKIIKSNLHNSTQVVFYIYHASSGKFSSRFVLLDDY